MAVQFRVHDVAMVNRALEQADADIRAQGKTELLALGQLVEHTAEILAAARIRNMTVQWAQFRTRQTPNLVYVVPVQKGVRGRGPRKRQRFDNTMMNKAMRPALNAHRGEVNRRFAALVERVCNSFNKAAV
jgi:hypothetical protein